LAWALDSVACAWVAAACSELVSRLARTWPVHRLAGLHVHCGDPACAAEVQVALTQRSEVAGEREALGDGSEGGRGGAVLGGGGRAVSHPHHPASGRDHRDGDAGRKRAAAGEALQVHDFLRRS
jgi:hypothetical protein